MDKVFQSVNDQIQELEKKLEQWKKLQQQKNIPQLDDLIQRQSDELESFKRQAEDFKIQIVFRGTMSSGKSTLINSLMGSELLTSRNNETTKKYFIISPFDQIKINGESYQEYKLAYEYLEKIQDQKGITYEKITVQAPSLFHRNLSPELRKRVVFIDCPGIKQAQEEDQRNQENECEMISKNNPVIDVWVLNFTTFDDDQKRICNEIENYEKIKEFKKSQKPQKIKSFKQVQGQEINNQEKKTKIKERQIYLLNKWDQYKSSKDKNKDTIISEINKRVGDEHIIFRISAERNLKYQIMKSDNVKAQQFFIENCFKDNEDDQKFKNEDDCKKYILKNIEQESQYEYFDFLKSLNNQIELKVYAFQNSLMQSYCISQDYYLMMRLQFQVQHTLQKTPQIEEYVATFQKEFQNILTDYNKCLQQKASSFLFLIEASIKYVEECFQKENKNLIKENLLSGCSQSILLYLDSYEVDLEQLSQQYRSKSTEIISKVELNIFQLLIDQNVIKELNFIWNELWTKFNDQQATQRKKYYFIYVEILLNKLNKLLLNLLGYNLFQRVK